MTLEEVKQTVRNIPDFPISGIQFKDLTTAFLNPDALHTMKEAMVALYKDKGITKVVGIESRGLIMAPAVAIELGAGFVPIRKPGKLPGEVIEETYAKEYGTDTIQIHKGALSEDDIVLLHDDLLATGGTMLAAIRLCQKFGVKKIYVNFLTELDGLEGRKVFDPSIEVTSLFHFPDK
ncbi:MAG: adenine phosphoribosyltransferase [Paludibacteraceae bacterium]